MEMYMTNLLNSKKCPYNKSMDISKKSYKDTCKQLDYCNQCNRYFQCDKVAELNDRLVETEILD